MPPHKLVANPHATWVVSEVGDLQHAVVALAGVEEDEIRRCAEDIAQELDRAFLIIRNLNTFAHLADHPIAEFDSVGLLMG